MFVDLAGFEKAGCRGERRTTEDREIDRPPGITKNVSKSMNIGGDDLRNFLRTAHLFVGLSFLAACSSASHERVRETFADVDTISLAPVSVVGIPGDTDEAARYVEEVLVADLERRGFDVIRPSEHRDLGPSPVSQTDGLTAANTNGSTGESAHPEPALENRADIVAHPTIELTVVDFSQANAGWDGASQRIEETFAPDCSGCLRALHFYKGEVPASTFRIKMVNAANDVVYTGSGGIELLVRYAHQSFTKADFEQIPDAELFQDEDRMKEAVRHALKPLIETN